MGRKLRRAKTTKRAFNLKLKKGTTYSIVQVIFFSLAALVLISFSRRGSILIEINDFLWRMFAWSTLFLPFIFLTGALLVSKVKNPLGQPNVVIGSILFFISIATLGRSGVLGSEAWGGTATLITATGAFIVLLETKLVG